MCGRFKVGSTHGAMLAFRFRQKSEQHETGIDF
jgi:hypothetical protein